MATQDLVDAALATWRDAALVFQSKLQDYLSETSSTGKRALGERWRAAEAVVAAPVPPLGEAAAGLAALMARADGVEATVRRLADAAEVILDPGVRASVAVGMSRTYSDTIGARTRAVSAARAAADAAQARVLEAANAEPPRPSGPPAEAQAAYRAAPSRGVVATELYVVALLEAAKDEAMRAEAVALLEAAKAEALGGGEAPAPSFPTPLQSMNYVAEYRRGEGEAIRVGSGNVHYEPDRLTSQARALEFGPIATAATGLSYRLVERLHTIRVERSPTVPSAVDHAAEASGPVVVSLDGGAPIAVARPAAGPWRPFGGETPLVDLYNAACEATFDFEAAREAADVVAEYEARVIDGGIPTAATDGETIARAVVAAFTRAHPPDGGYAPEEFDQLVAKGARTYLVSALSEVTAAVFDKRMRAAMRSPQYPAIERRERASQAALVSEVARDLQRKIAEKYRPFSGEATWERLIAHLRRAVDAAVGVEPIYCDVPSLARFAQRKS